MTSETEDRAAPGAPAAQTVVLALAYDFNDPPNDAGFYEVVLPMHLENLVHRGDIVDVTERERDSGVAPVRGRVRCLVAVVERIP